MKAFLLLFLTFNLCGMDEPDLALTPMNPGIFERLNEHKNMRGVIFGLLQPSSVNGLRKTCKKMSEIFSFCNPTIEFISCNNKNIFINDLRRIFFTSIFDARQDIVTHFAKSAAVTSRYEIPGTSDAFYPYFLAHNEVTRLSLKHLKDKFLYSPSRTAVLGDKSLLIACVSRNSERVKQVLTNSTFILDEYIILRALHIVRDGSDMQSFTEMLENEKIREYITRNGAVLINQAIFYGSKKSCEVLIASKLCDINQTIVTQSPGSSLKFCFFGDEFCDAHVKPKNSTLLDEFLDDEETHEMKFGKEFVQDIKTLLIKNGAKTSEELEKEHRGKIIA